jgi:hypothetical protein
VIRERAGSNELFRAAKLLRSASRRPAKAQRRRTSCCSAIRVSRSEFRVLGTYSYSVILPERLHAASFGEEDCTHAKHLLRKLNSGRHPLLYFGPP